jgi:tetratricopeptide (TPR) repeat protein
MTEHPSVPELEGMLHGTLTGERLRYVVRHFLRGCPECVRTLGPQVMALLGPDHFVPRRQRTLTGPKIAPLARIAHTETTPANSAYREFEELLRRCRALRHDHPSKLLELAERLVQIASTMNPGAYGQAATKDYQCKAWVEMANAYRICDRHTEAEASLREAAKCFAEGSQSELLEARMLEIRASLLGDRREFAQAGEIFDGVFAIYRRHNDDHLAGRALISKGLVAGHSGDSDSAIRLTQEGLELLDCERDPRLVFIGVHNLSSWLVDSERYEEARLLLHTYQGSLRRHVRNPLDRLRMRWHRAEIAAGMGEMERAEKGLQRVQKGFDEAGLPYKAALVSLELATVHLRQGRTEDARAGVLQAVGVFSSLGIHREALMGVLLLRRAFEVDVTSTNFLHGLIGFLRRAEDNPQASFQDWLKR